MDLIIPKKLNKGDAIGIVFPSAGISPKAKHRLDQAQRTLEGMGFKIILGKHIISQNNNYVSGSASERIDDIHSMFMNPEVKMIMAGIGGNHSNHLLAGLDYEMIRKNPKIVIGYSDITVLHYALYSKAGLATYYGPCAATQFGEYPEVLNYTRNWFGKICISNIASSNNTITPSAEWTDEFLDWFTQSDRARARIMKKNSGYKWLQAGCAKGKALPGCILSMNRLAGTQYWIDPTDKIMFLDILSVPGEIDEASVDSFLTDLKNIGVFDVISGLVIGRPYGYSNEAKQRLYKQIGELTKKKYPIVAEFDIGHTDPMATIRYDQLIQLDSAANLVQVLD